ncbi:MAG TPA: response regulator [Pirellulales bacterium]|nr:response regulator [Pirellulales bacterium]
MSVKILLCDDEVHIVRAAEFKLARAGYDVRCAADGQEAWEIIQQDPPDLLITDLQMPRLGGLQLIERLRQRPDTNGLPVIVLTAKGFELKPQELAERWGVLAVVGKPFSPRELLHLVESSVPPPAAATTAAAGAMPTVVGGAPAGPAANPTAH